MADDLDKKGLSVNQLLGMEVPGDLTIAVALAASAHILAGLKETFSREMYIRLGWRYHDGREVFPDPETTTMYQWWGPYVDREHFVQVDDGSGGVKSPEPELVP